MHAEGSESMVKAIVKAMLQRGRVQMHAEGHS